MARKLTAKELRNGKGEENLDWDTWFGGGTWELKRGTDFFPRVDIMRQKCYSEARRRGIKVRVNVLDDEKTIHVTLRS